MTAVLSEEEVKPTPAAFSGWSIDVAPDTYTRTNHSLPQTFIRLGPEVRFGDAGLFASGESSTDLAMVDRVISFHVPDLAKSLLQYSAVAKLIIPGLREITARERTNLRNYYKKVYRKV